MAYALDLVLKFGHTVGCADPILLKTGLAQVVEAAECSLMVLMPTAGHCVVELPQEVVQLGK